MENSLEDFNDDDFDDDAAGKISSIEAVASTAEGRGFLHEYSPKYNL